jgi:hypothetical protein
MERLDVLFAMRYFEAYDAYRQGLSPTQSWQIALHQLENKQLILLQHLLLGINAHINLDLGIAAVQTVDQQPLEMLRADFDAINRILAELVDEVKANLSAVSPVFGYLMPLARQLDEKLVNFSIEVARQGAWRFACKLYANPEPDSCILERDQQVAKLAQAMVKPGRILSWLLWCIRLGEWRSPKQVAQVLSA